VNVHKNAKLTPAGRAELVRRVLIEKQKVGEVSRAMGVSAPTVRKWVHRYRAGGVSSLADRPSRPRSSPRQLQLKLVERIERLRRRKYTGLRIAEELKLAVSTVSLWLRRLGLGRLRFLEPKPVVVRYERRRPGELLHVDTKKLARIRTIGHRITGDRRGNRHGLGWEFLHVCVDDATRVAYAEVLPDERNTSASAFIERAIAWFKERDVHVEGVMTDNGSCYRSSRFRRALESSGIRHLWTRPYRPQTNGKAERFIQTTKREWAYARAYRTSAARTQMLAGFLNRYNSRRPHRALGNQTPLSRLEDLVNNVLVSNS
jgi:transposase InsO family protein